jgi:hypothetical protein
VAAVTDRASLVEADAAAAASRERELWEAYRAKDRERIEALVDPLALDAGPAGALDRDGVVAAVGRMRIDAYDITDLRARRTGAVEIVTYRSRAEGAYEGAPLPARDVVCTSVWCLDGGRWRLVHRHESPARA